MHQFDVKTAFLHSPIEDEKYLEQPQEFVKQGPDGEKLVCRLNNSNDGLKQAANNWYKELANFLLRQRFTRSRNDNCLFARAEAEGHTFILVWVDIIVASRSMTVISDVKKALESTFHMEDRGRLHWFLGLKIRREDGKVTVDQERYIETMLERFHMDQCKPSRTQADLNLKLQTAQSGDEEVDQRIYRSLVGSLLYLAKQTRPDIMFRVNLLSRHMNATTNQRMCGKRLLPYLQGSKGLKLTYTKEASYDLVGVRTTRVVLNSAKTQSCTRGANTLRLNFTSFGTRRKMGLFQFITFLLTKWQPTSSRNLYPYGKWKHSELF